QDVVGRVRLVQTSERVDRQHVDDRQARELDDHETIRDPPHSIATFEAVDVARDGEQGTFAALGLHDVHRRGVRLTPGLVVVYASLAASSPSPRMFSVVMLGFVFAIWSFTQSTRPWPPVSPE